MEQSIVPQKSMNIQHRVERVASALFLATQHLPEFSQLRSESRGGMIRAMAFVNDALQGNSEILPLMLSQVQYVVSLLSVMHAAGEMSQSNARLLIQELNTILQMIDQYNKEQKNAGIEKSQEAEVDVQGILDLPRVAFAESFSQHIQESENNKEENKVPHVHLDQKDTVEHVARNKKEQRQKEAPIKKINPSSNQENQPGISSGREKFLEGIRIAQTRQKLDANIAIAQKKKATNDSPKKQERKNQILTALQQESNANIKDIIPYIVGVSEKTLQRDLIELIEEGKVLRQGSRRWSTYALA